MTKNSKTFEDTIEVTELFIGEILKEFPNVKWADDENSFTMPTGNKIVLDDISEKNPGDKVKTIITGEKFLKKFSELETKQKELTKDLVTKSKVKGTALKNCFDYEYDFNGLIKNGKIFNQVNTRLNKIGISDVFIGKEINQDNIASDNVEIYINPSFNLSHKQEFSSGELTRLKEVIFSSIKDKDATTSSDFNCVTPSNYYTLIFEEEEVKEIKLFGKIIGRYYVERNQIHFYMNPFSAKKINSLSSSLPDLIELTLSSLEVLKIKKCKKEDFINTLFVRLFMKKSTEEAIRMEKQIASNIKTMVNFESDILRMMQENNNFKDQISFLKSDSKTKGAELIKSINKVKDLPFIKKVEIEGVNINLTFKETNVKIPYLKLNGIKYGKAKFYLGEIKIQIKPDGFKIYNNTLSSSCFGGHAHPHANGNPGSPCLGSGEGKKTIMDMLHQCKFVDLSRMLWIWVKTYLPGGAYYHEYELFKYCVGHGIPLWDEKDKPIDIKVANDKYKITVSKESDHNANVKKYSHIKP